MLNKSLIIPITRVKTIIKPAKLTKVAISSLSDFFKIWQITVIIIPIAAILKKSDRDDIATLVSLAGLIIVLTLVIGMISDLFNNIKEIFGLF